MLSPHPSARARRRRRHPARQKQKRRKRIVNCLCFLRVNTDNRPSIPSAPPSSSSCNPIRMQNGNSAGRLHRLIVGPKLIRSGPSSITTEKKKKTTLGGGRSGGAPSVRHPIERHGTHSSDVFCVCTAGRPVVCVFFARAFKRRRSGDAAPRRTRR